MIFNDFKSSVSPQDCITHLQNSFVREALDLSTLRRWYAEFHRGRVPLHNESRGGWPSIAITEENVIDD